MSTPSPAHQQVTGYADFSGVKGDTLIQALSLDPTRLTLDVGVLIAWYAFFVLLALALGMLFAGHRGRS